ncbi:GSK3B [Lepeophtheirus salmonis]|uniref:GSK3B n=1 Tax=Lepeophtheirus salmonis TaxID=72036 RepID=A0A7R8HBZ7_LEPSM|nr:GSK3B [Lepeophtheirus salmonis]CAF2997224.1 GSK3B [Lepeophtheirus salmonis]
MFLGIFRKFHLLFRCVTFNADIMHDVYHCIETNGPSDHTKARKLPQDELKAAKGEFNHMLEFGIKDTHLLESIYYSVMTFDEFEENISIKLLFPNGKIRTQDILFSIISLEDQGTFGSVYRVKPHGLEGYSTSESLMAMKVLSLRNRGINRELKVLKKLNHSNIVRLIGYTKDENNLKLFFPLCYDSKSHAIQICDFGSALILNDSTLEPLNSYICSRYYRAPELLLGSTSYDYKIDIWSAACVWVEMFKGEPPFWGETTGDQLVEIVSALGSPSAKDLADMRIQDCSSLLPILKSILSRLESPSLKNKVSGSMSEKQFEVLNKLFSYSPSERPTAKETYDLLTM